MKIYTGQGDLGLTYMGDGLEVSKASFAIGAIGAVDELNAYLGVVLSLLKEFAYDQNLLSLVQEELFQLGAELASSRKKFGNIEDAVSYLETAIDTYEKELPPLKNLILPGGCQISAYLHFARTICRRAERQVVAFYEYLKRSAEKETAIRRELGQSDATIPINQKLIVYLNRLSDLLFVMARFANGQGKNDVVWKPS